VPFDWTTNILESVCKVCQLELSVLFKVTDRSKYRYQYHFYRYQFISLLYRRAFTVSQLSVSENVGLTMESYRTNEIESIFCHESNQIKIINSKSECTHMNNAALDRIDSSMPQLFTDSNSCYKSWQIPTPERGKGALLALSTHTKSWIEA